MGRVKRSVVGGEEDISWYSTEDFQGSENILYDGIMMDTCLYTLV